MLPPQRVSKGRSRRRRSHDALSAIKPAICPVSGMPKRRPNLSSSEGVSLPNAAPSTRSQKRASAYTFPTDRRASVGKSVFLRRSRAGRETQCDQQAEREQDRKGEMVTSRNHDNRLPAH